MRIERRLEGKKVFIKSPEKSELSFIRWLWADEATMKEVGGIHKMTDEQALKWFEAVCSEKTERNLYCLIYSNDEKPVGEVSCHKVDKQIGSGSFNIKIAALHRSRGYAKEAMVLFLGYYFNELDFTCMMDDIALENTVSHKFFLNFGFDHLPDHKDVFMVKMTKERFNVRYPACGQVVIHTD